MLLDALATIGDELAEQNFESKYLACCDPDSLRGNQTIETVVELEFKRIEGELTYRGTRVVDPIDPLEMAIKYGYVNRYNQYDHSLTQRASSSVLTEFDRMIDWPQDDAIGDAADDPFIQELADAFETYASDIRDDIEQYDESIDYKALLTIRFQEDGSIQYPGEIDTLARGTFNAYKKTLGTASSATGSSGIARCAVCDEESETFGLGAGLDAIYTLKKQWPFPKYNASNAWQSRPLCAKCISNLETASKLFLDRQDYGAPGVRCRIVPYALPVDGGKNRLRNLIRGGYENLTNAESEQPLSNAWDQYRMEADRLGDEDVLRLSFVHYIRDSNKSHGVATIDGVSIDYVDSIIETFETVLDTHPFFQMKPFSDLTSPSEQQVFTGMWLYDLLCDVSDSDHESNSIGDDNRWANYTEALLTASSIRYGELVNGVVREAVVRYRERLSDDEQEDYPYDGFHVAQAFAFQRTCARLGLLTDDHTVHTMNLDSITGDYVTLGDGIAEFIDAHDSIDQSPGRSAAFVLGAVAAQLSAWQMKRNLNRTFVQNRDAAHLSTENLSKWETAIWQKAKTYNAQNGNYGIPWSAAQELFHEAVLRGENEGWNASKDELQYHYILGVTFGPKVAAQASENQEQYAEEDESKKDMREEQNIVTEYEAEN